MFFNLHSLKSFSSYICSRDKSKFMGFDCPYYQDSVCVLQKGKCVPAIGNCILKGKVSRAKDEGKDKKQLDGK